MKFEESLVMKIAREAGPAPDRETIRDVADILSGGELDHIEIEILTDRAIRVARSLHTTPTV